MALELTKELQTGVEANYWKITRVVVEADKCILHVSLFMTEAARVANKAPIDSATFVWIGADNPCTLAAMDTDNPYVLCYEKLKTLAEFAGAEDV